MPENRPFLHFLQKNVSDLSTIATWTLLKRTPSYSAIATIHFWDLLPTSIWQASWTINLRTRAHVSHWLPPTRLVPELTWGDNIELVCYGVEEKRKRKHESKLQSYNQPLGSANKTVFWTWIYNPLTGKLPSSLPLGGGLVLVLFLFRQECTRQVHAEVELSTKLVDLDYHHPLLGTSSQFHQRAVLHSRPLQVSLMFMSELPKNRDTTLVSQSKRKTISSRYQLLDNFIPHPDFYSSKFV